jgi:hypothetical protein
MASRSSPRVPDFFIVGHAKSGTTALYEMLRRHPGIFMCEPKEPWFFARENPNPQTTGERSIAFTGRKSETLSEYLARFASAGANQRTGEASSSYLWSQTAPARIASMRPDARIVAIFREPAAFLRSLHLQHLSTYLESEKSFRRVIELDPARREDRHIPKQGYWPQSLVYTDRVRYVEQLRRYRESFPEEQILVLVYDDFRTDNAGSIREVLRFLDVDDSHPIELLEANPTIGVRSVRVNDFRHSLRVGSNPALRGIRNAGKALTTKRLREAVYYPLIRRAVYAEPPPVDAEFMLELRRRFAPEVEAFSEYVGRDLVSLWGYDRLSEDGGSGLS